MIRQFNKKFFTWLHGNNLVYNTCWEDPACDREALQLTDQDTVVVITSAGCNTLDYALDGPKAIHAVDVNYRQNSLLHLKIAAINLLDFDEFFELFGKGRFPKWNQVYKSKLRPHLPDYAREFWDSHGNFFNGTRKRSFYFCGTSGAFARWMNFYIDHVAGARKAVTALLATDDIQVQKKIYNEQLKPKIWGRLVRFMIRRGPILSMLGVPKEQRVQVDRAFKGGVSEYIEARLDDLFTRSLMSENYFWRVYLTGEYTPECCPNYLKPECFEQLRSGLTDRIHIHTTMLLDFFREDTFPITRFILLDHMDWLSGYDRTILQEQWQAIVDRAAPGSRLLWRSAAYEVDFVDPVEVTVDGEKKTLGDLFDYQRELTARLHAQDRVNTYGSFYIADLPESNCATATAAAKSAAAESSASRAEPASRCGCGCSCNAPAKDEGANDE